MLLNQPLVGAGFMSPRRCNRFCRAIPAWNPKSGWANGVDGLGMSRQSVRPRFSFSKHFLAERPPESGGARLRV
jgi:hypothetical protein